MCGGCVCVGLHFVASEMFHVSDHQSVSRKPEQLGFVKILFVGDQ